MEITAPVTDYIRRSTLTAIGDILIRGGTVPIHLPIGSQYQVLRVDIFGETLEYVQPGEFLFVYESSANNSILVTLGVGYTDIVIVNLGTLALGERWNVQFNATINKDGTAGEVILRLLKEAGTATVKFLHAMALLPQRAYIQANGVITMSYSIIMQVTVPGTFTLKVDGNSMTTEASIFALDAEIYTHRMKEG